MQDRPADLLLAIFDIFAIGGTDPRTAHKHPNEAWFVTDVTDTLHTIFALSCETQYEMDHMKEMVDTAVLSNFAHLKRNQGQTKEQRVQEGIAAKKAEEAALIAAGGDPEEVKKEMERRKRSRKQGGSGSGRSKGSSNDNDESVEEKTGADRLAEIRDAKFANDSPYELELALRKYDLKMYRKDFRAFMRTCCLPCVCVPGALCDVPLTNPQPSTTTTAGTHADTLVKKFQSYCWQRLPVDCRLQSLDEHQLLALRTSDTIMYRFKLEQALHIYTKSLYRRMFDDWNAAAKTLSVVRRHAQRRFHVRKVQFFRFWRKLSSTCLLPAPPAPAALPVILP